MKVLVVGSGGREHALCWALSASPVIDHLYCAPGNGGIADDATCVDLSLSDIDGVVTWCRDQGIDLVVVGPEGPLVDGLVDRLEAAGIKAFGPSAAASALEGSKGFTKDLCARYGIPTASYGRFSEPGPAKEFIRANALPIVVKADGLAAGKGVIIAQTLDEAEAAVDDILAGQFGDAGAEVVVEEFLRGEEASFFVLVDGEHILPLVTAQDHKRVGEGDTGPNTGGMGAYSPAPVMTPALCDQVMTTIIEPTVAAMKSEGRPYKGVLYAGLMITDDGPMLLEYNVRFGDPECQVLIARLKSDLLPALVAVSDGMLDQVDLRWHDKTAMVVVMAARGYPGAYDKGSEIRGLDKAGTPDEVVVFHAGTRRDGESIIATGGRVLGVTALGDTVAQARARAYQAVDAIDWSDGFCRRDIGWRAVERGPEKDWI
ncbi:MAG: phosphoribosylamine--glycine ligase [Sphingomonadales bacterium]